MRGLQEVSARKECTVVPVSLEDSSWRVTTVIKWLQSKCKDNSVQFFCLRLRIVIVGTILSNRSLQIWKMGLISQLVQNWLFWLFTNDQHTCLSSKYAKGHSHWHQRQRNGNTTYTQQWHTKMGTHTVSTTLMKGHNRDRSMGSYLEQWHRHGHTHTAMTGLWAHKYATLTEENIATTQICRYVHNTDR